MLEIWDSERRSTWTVSKAIFLFTAMPHFRYPMITTHNIIADVAMARAYLRPSMSETIRLQVKNAYSI